MATTHVGSIYWDASIKGIKQAQGQLKSLQSQINGMKQKEGLFDQILGGLKGLPGLRGTLQSFSKFVTRLGDNLVHFGQIASVFSYRLSILVAGFAALGVKIGVVAAEFEENLAQIGTQLDIRGGELERFTGQLGQHIIDLSKELPVAANDIARAMYFIVSSMDVPEETAQAILEPLSIAAVAGRSTVEEMAGAVAVIGNVYDHILVMADGTARFVKDDMEGAIALTNATAEQVAAAVTHTTDVLFEGVQKGRAEVRDYTSQVGDFLQVAASAGASLEEALAFFTSATRITTSSQAATWTANFYRQLLRPEFAEKLAEWGIQLEQIVEGTGEWATRQRELNKEEERNLEQVNRKLKGAEGVTGLYLKEAKLIESIGYVQWQISQKDSAARQKSLRDKNRDLDITKQQIAFYEKQGEAIASLDQQQVRYWTGKETFRPTLDIFADLVEVIENTSSKQEQLNMITAAFPNVRATQAFLRFIGAYKDIVTWSKEWETVTGQTQEAFDLMADTVNARIFVLKNNIFALGMAFYLAYEDQIKVFIDGLTSIVMLFQTLDPALVRQIALWGLLIFSLAPLMLLVGTIAIGLGTFVTTIGMLISPGVLGTAGVLFTIFGGSVKEAWDAISKYEFANMTDVVQFFVDLAVQLGLISESDAVDILVGLGASLMPFGDPAVVETADAIRKLVDRISEVKDDIVEWAQAFHLFFEDVANREGIVGTLVGLFEDLWNAVSPMLGLQGKKYEEAGPEEKARIIDLIIGALAIKEILTNIMNVAAAVVNLSGPGLLGIGAAIALAITDWLARKQTGRGLLDLSSATAEARAAAERMEAELQTEKFEAGGEQALLGRYGELQKAWEEAEKARLRLFRPEYYGGMSEEFKTEWGIPSGALIKQRKEELEAQMKVLIDYMVSQGFVGAPIPTGFTEEEKESIAYGKVRTAMQTFSENITTWVDGMVTWYENVLSPLIGMITEEVVENIGELVSFFGDWLETLSEIDLIQLFKDLVSPLGELKTHAENIGVQFDNLKSIIKWIVDHWPFGGGNGGNEGESKQFGGVMRRTARVLAHKGEVFFNPRYPRQDLARVVNRAMARAGGGGGGSSISLAPVLNIGSFGGSQAEMNQLQRMLENMSFDMAMRVERKLAEARRVENRRRQ